jgi:cytochrome c peroxidase
MNKTLVIGILLMVMAGCAVYTRRSGAQTPEKEITARIVMQIDSFSALITNQLLPAVQDRKTDPQRLRQLFRESRLAYKKFEWAAEYFTAVTTRNVNGPPVPESGLDGSVRQPTGLQVIEADLYPRYDLGKRQEIIRQLRSVISDCGMYSAYYKTAGILNWQVWDAAKLEVFRVLTLGITGFDAPLAKTGISESASSLLGVGQALADYPNGDDHSNLKLTFRKAILYLEADTAFDNFNRALFITAYGNPLTTAINKVQQNLNLPPGHRQRLLRQNAATLFDASAFDASAYAAYPEDSATADQIALGEKLFNDPLLSGTGSRNCAFCHQPQKAFTDGMAKNATIDGPGLVKRNTPTLFNAAFQPAQFADLRENTLEGQAKNVIESKPEMHGSIQLASDRLSDNADYKRLFAAAYPKNEGTGIGKKEITGAIAAYVRTLSVLNSRFDSYMRGNPSAMNADEVNGFNLFMGKAKCGTCHYMPLFNGALPPLFQRMDAEVIGVPADAKGTMIDADRGRYSITYAIPDDHAFKTPTIRNAARTAPYMHNGVFASLEEVIDFYNNGGGAGMGIKIPNQTLSAEPMNLSAKEKQELIAFIKCLDNQ